MTIRNFFKWLFGTLLVMSVITAIAIVSAASQRRALTRNQERWFNAYVLADQLRHTSEDLTKFARMYVATGDPKYERYYHDILAVRRGLKPRIDPDTQAYGYQGVLMGGSEGSSDVSKPLIGKLEAVGLTEGELAKVKEALAESDDLARTEDVAMHAVRGLYADSSGAFTRKGRPNRAQATQMMYDDAYVQKKAKIMKPIDDFLVMIAQRSLAERESFK